MPAPPEAVAHRPPVVEVRLWPLRECAAAGAPLPVGGLLAQEEGDVEEAERGAHSLKSSAANIGAETLRTLATRMESAALEGNPDDARAILPEIESAYADAMQELKKLQTEIKE